MEKMVKASLVQALASLARSCQKAKDEAAVGASSGNASATSVTNGNEDNGEADASDGAAGEMVAPTSNAAAPAPLHGRQQSGFE